MNDNEPTFEKPVSDRFSQRLKVRLKKPKVATIDQVLPGTTNLAEEIIAYEQLLQGRGLEDTEVEEQVRKFAEAHSKAPEPDVAIRVNIDQLNAKIKTDPSQN